jgi:flagellar biogenesis protein FliO
VILSYLLTLVGVCGLAVGSLVVVRAVKGGGLSIGAAQPIRVVGRQGVGGGSSLLLIEVDGKRMLIAVSRSGVSMLEGSVVGLTASPSEAERHCRAQPRLTLPTVLGFARTGPSASLGKEKLFTGGSFSATLKRAGMRW